MKTKNNTKSDIYVGMLLHVQSYEIGAHGPTVSYFRTWNAARKHAKAIGGADIIQVIIQSEYPLEYSEGCTYYGLTRGKCNAFIEPYAPGK